MRLMLIAAARLAVAASVASAAVTPRHTVNLANGRFDGHTILGLTPAQVEAVLGRPDATHGSKARYVFDWGKASDLRFRVIFTEQAASERAVLLGFESGIYRDPKLGDVLKRKPAAFLSAMEASYGDVYRLVSPLKHKPGGLYIGEFGQRAGTLHVSFGTHPKLGTFLTIWYSAG